MLLCVFYIPGGVFVSLGRTLWFGVLEGFFSCRFFAFTSLRLHPGLGAGPERRGSRGWRRNWQEQGAAAEAAPPPNNPGRFVSRSWAGLIRGACVVRACSTCVGRLVKQNGGEFVVKFGVTLPVLHSRFLPVWGVGGGSLA